ncbi:MAG: hypothetical protein M3506_07365, partial [Chloroflexota bacterium]|nr:hypothetical protein [Chloroflexota bacterium]
FTILPLSLAAKAYVLSHLLLAGLSTYALARSLGMRLPGALLAATAYELTGLLYVNSSCCPNHTGIAAWLPFTLLGAELAVRSTGWLPRLIWWGASGFGLSQVLAIWLGQGAYYVGLTLGGYVAYRTLVDLPIGGRGAVRRVVDLVMHGGAIVLFGLGLAAAGLLPRLEYNSFSNLADGYANLAQQSEGGWGARSWHYLLRLDRWYTGAIALGLAVGAVFLARRRYAVPFWVVLSLAVVFLARSRSTPLYSLVYLLPRFEELHTHAPARVLTVFYLAPALLAGATVDCLADVDKKVPWQLLLPSVTLLLVVAAAGFAAVVPIGGIFLIAAVFTVVLLAAAVLFPLGRQTIAWLLVLLAATELLVAGRVVLDERRQIVGAHGSRKANLAAYTEPRGAGQFLLRRMGDERFRYFGYEPYARGRYQAYPPRWADPMTAALLVNNRATTQGLEDLQGYNPVHVARYDAFLRALNGSRQGYRSASVSPQGLVSPLLDLLNTRYIVVPASWHPGRSDLAALDRAHDAVYDDGQVRILARSSVLPRAWLVHRAQRVGRARGLEMLAERAVDPRQVALLYDPPPPLSYRGGGKGDNVEIVDYQPDRIVLRASTQAEALLVLSEVYYPAWKAYVNDKPVRLYAANHLLRAVPVPVGTSDVELRYESGHLTVGLLVSGVSYFGIAALVLAWMASWWRRRI